MITASVRGLLAARLRGGEDGCCGRADAFGSGYRLDRGDPAVVAVNSSR